MKDWYSIAVAGIYQSFVASLFKGSVSVLFDGLKLGDATTLLSQGSILRQISKYVRLSQ